MNVTGAGSTTGRARAYAIAMVSVALALVARAALDTHLRDEQPFAPFYVAVAVSAWFGGLGPGVVALVLGYVLSDYFFIAPRYEINGPSAIAQVVDAAIFVFVNVVVLLLTESMRRAGRRANAEAEAARRARRASDGALEALARVHAVSEAALVDLPLDEFLAKLIDRVRGALHAEAAVILLEDERAALCERAHSAVSGSHPAPAVAFAAEIAKHRCPLVWEEIACGRLGDAGETCRHSLAGVPLLAKGRVVGVLHVGSTEPHAFRDDAVRLLQLAAERAALGMERASLVDGERRARVDAETANRAKDDFLAVLGHELRSPLAPVQNAVHVLRLLGDHDAKLRHVRDIIDRQVSHIVRLVDDLFDVSRIAHGKIALRKTRIALGDVVAQAVETARPLIERSALELRVETPSRVVWTHADQTRLVQAVSNVLVNAAKFTPAGGTITVTLEERDALAIVRVRDTGIGIAADALERVFEPFAQEELPPGAQRAGLGIGLALVKRLVEMHGGAVAAHSDGKDRGTMVTLTLPVLGATLPEVTAAVDTRAAETFVPLDVLIVEDDTDAAESLMMCLELVGHHVRIARDGPTALRLIQAAPPDAVLVDIGLPGITGYDVARRVREIATMKHALLVALTGYGREDDRRRALTAGFDHHLVKPVDLDALQALLAGDRLDPATAQLPTLH